MTTMAELEQEIAQLRKEVAELREEFNTVAIVHREDDGKICGSQLQPDLLVVETIILRNDAGKNHGTIGAGDDGAFLSFFGENEKARVTLRVEEDDGLMEFYDNDQKQLVQIVGRPQYGQVAVFSAGGIPRALMKAMANGGAVTVVDPEGTPCAVMHSAEQKGEVALVAQGKTAAKFTSGSGGGELRLLNREGKPSCALLSADAGNALFLSLPDGRDGASLMASAAGTLLSMGRGPVESEARPAVELCHIPGMGAHLRFCDDKSNAVAEMANFGNGGEISLNEPGDGGSVKLQVNGGGGRIETGRGDSESRIILNSAKTGPIAAAIGEEDVSASMFITNNKGMVAVKKGDHIQGLMTVADDGESGAIMLTNEDNTNAVNVASSKEGGRIIIGSSDGTTQAALFSTEEGAQLRLCNDLGIERASLMAKEDSGGLHLRFGGLTGMVAAATDRGGLLTVHDSEGQVAEALPAHQWSEGDESEDEPD